MTLDLKLIDLKPEKKPEKGNFYGCPTTKSRHPSYLRISGEFNNLEELWKLFIDDLKSLNLDLSKAFKGVIGVKEIITGASVSYPKSEPFRITKSPILFDSRTYNNFVRIYNGKAELGDDYLIDGYEIATKDGGFMMIFYFLKQEQKSFLLITNDGDYVNSHKLIDWGENAVKLLYKLL